MKTKTVNVILTFQAEVPEDMEINDLIDAVERKWEDMDDFRVSVEDYHKEEDQDPLFTKDDFSVCEGYTLMTERERVYKLPNNGFLEGGVNPL